MNKFTINKKNILTVLFLILVSIPSVFSLLNSGFFQSDDGEWMIVRFSAFHQAFRDGQFPVRFLGRLNNGYGYPVANFLYPGFMYAGEFIRLSGFDFVNTIKIIFGFSLVGSAVFAYFWLSKLFNKTSAFFGALFYLYTPYHLFDFYKRGSIGEILALAVLPFILWQIERKSLFWISSGIGFIILSHNTLALLFMPVIILYALLKYKKSFIFYFLSFTLGLGLSSFFWIPAISELSYTRFSSTVVSDFRDYFASMELIGFSTIFILSLSSFFTFNIFLNKEKSKQKLILNKMFILMSVLAFFSILLSSKISLPIWNLIPSSFVQFPFRLLSYLPVALAFLAAYIVFNLDNKKRVIVSVFFIIILFISSFPYLRPAGFFDKGDPFYATNEGTTTVQDEYLPKWVKEKPAEHFKNKVEIMTGKGEIKGLVYSSNKITFNAVSNSDTKIKINTIFYPGWQAFANNRELDVQYSNKEGVMELSLPKGENSVKLIFSETPLRLFADILSVLSFLILILFIKVYKP